MKLNQKKLLCSLLSSAVLLGTSQIIFAEDAASEETFNFDEYVVTANRMPVKKSEVAANVTVITQEEIEKGSFTNLPDILKKSNIALQETGTSTVPVINGDDRVLVLVDGRRIGWDHLVISGNSHAGIDLNSLPIKNIERIEIVRGPASSLYGSDAVGGIINIITRKAKTANTSISSEFGSWGFERYSLTTEGKENGIGYLITAEKKTRDDFKYKNPSTGKTETKNNSGFDQEYLTMRLDKDLSNDRSLSLDLEHADDKSGYSGTNNPYFVYPNGYRKQVDDNIALTYHWGQNNGAENFFRIYHNETDLKYWDSFNSIADLYANGFNWQQNWQLAKNYTLTGGADWREEHLDDKESINKGYTSKALFLENRWQFVNNWSITAGGRYDDHSISGENTTSRLTVNKELNADTNVYASWGQYVKNPTMQDLFWDNGWTIGNPNLKPEEGTTTTLGINTKLGDGTKLQASVYSSRLKNALEFKSGYDSDASDPDASYISGYGYYVPGYYYNASHEKRRGLDLSLTRELSPQWTVGLGYTYNKTQVQDENGNYVNYTSNSQPNGYRLNVQYDQDKWDAGLTLRSATGRSLEEFTSKSYVTLDMLVNYKINPATRIYLKAYNLTNEAYELTSAGTLGNGPGSYPMPGRSFYLGVEHRM
ncbi:TonB-dependent receptor plug domain-containing protein [Propionispora vibrioides]|uniref:Vitamin B12 transporter n=1 Tax=Propionispora vibrioides TaxID=112903 RepID=A0A1H8W6C2_9FIRM|nr:TonB-dependent receptor [Propionispora vibrioides]SEP23204.1 vitamin B12 transporter [Propionispora vibrioides]